MNVYDNLTLTMRRKTARVKKFRSSLSMWTTLFLIFGMITSFLMLYIIQHTDIYTTFLMSFIDSGVPVETTPFDIKVLIGTIVTGGLTYFLFIMYSKSKERYNDLRKDIISSIGGRLFKDSDCGLGVEDYIRYMDRFKVDVVFK